MGIFFYLIGRAIKAFRYVFPDRQPIVFYINGVAFKCAAVEQIATGSDTLHFQLYDISVIGSADIPHHGCSVVVPCKDEVFVVDNFDLTCCFELSQAMRLNGKLTGVNGLASVNDTGDANAMVEKDKIRN